MATLTAASSATDNIAIYVITVSPSPVERFSPALTTVTFITLLTLPALTVTLTLPGLSAAKLPSFSILRTLSSEDLIRTISVESAGVNLTSIFPF